MFFEYPLTIPASTAATSPSIEEVVLAPGIISQVGIQFPPGCKGLAHVSIKERQHQLWPTNPDEYITADGWVVEWNEHHPLMEKPYTLSLYGYNEDDSYPHTVTFRFALLPLSALPGQRDIATRLEALKKALMP